MLGNNGSIDVEKLKYEGKGKRDSLNTLSHLSEQGGVRDRRKSDT